MKLRSLKIENYRNLISVELKTDAKVTGFTGPNGAGKTNLLDAIYFLSVGKSCINSVDLQNTHTDSDYFTILGNVVSEEEDQHTIRCAYSGSRKKVISRNKIPYERISEHIGFLPVIMLIPSDLVIITGNREERRKFVDTALSQINPPYLKALIKYNRTLEQRNVKLKQMQDFKHQDRGLIEVYDHQLSRQADFIHRERNKFLNELLPYFSKYYSIISDNSEEVSIQYRSELNDTDLLSLLNINFRQDLIMRRTTNGTHRDEFAFFLSGMPLKKYASQGQQKTFLFSLKLALNDLFAKHKGSPPLLLLDDIGDRLDSKRLNKLIELVSGKGFGQIFLTDTSSQRIEELFRNNSGKLQLFKVDNGSIVD